MFKSNDENKNIETINFEEIIGEIDLKKKRFKDIIWYDEIDMDSIKLWYKIPDAIRDDIRLGCIKKTCENYVYQKLYTLMPKYKKKCYHKRPFLTTLDKILEEQPNCRVLDLPKEEINKINEDATERYMSSSYAIGIHPEKNLSKIDPIIFEEYKEYLFPKRRIYFNWLEFASEILNEEEKEGLNPLEQLIKVIKDQDGSRQIQRKLDSFKPQNVYGTEAIEASEEWNNFLLLIIEFLPEMASNSFSNYVIQKLMEDEINHIDLKTYLFETNIKSLSIESYGCRVIQKGIEVFEKLEFFFKEIFEDLEELVSDQNANHVVQKLIDVVTQRSFINKEIIEEKESMIIRIINQIKNSVIFLSNKKFGCRVIQKLLESMNIITNNSINNFCPKYALIIERVLELKNQIINNILNSVEHLASHEYGNYVLQYIINDEPNIILEITKTLSINSLFYSTHKFASNVIENIIVKGNDITRSLLLDSFCKFHSEDNNRSKHILFFLARDRYGNYVVQQLFKNFIKGRKRITNILKIYSVELRATIYSKHILYKLLRQSQQQNENGG